MAPCRTLGCKGVTGGSGSARGWCARCYGRWYRNGDPGQLARVIEYQDLPATDAAYIAGLVDGDGCFHINERHHVGRPDSHHLWLTVQMTTEEAPKWLHAMIGGHLDLRRKKPPRRHLWRWTLQGRHVADLCIQLAPHLKTKADHVHVVRAFFDEWPWSNGIRVPDVERERRRVLRARMVALNARGAIG